MFLFICKGKKGITMSNPFAINPYNAYAQNATPVTSTYVGGSSAGGKGFRQVYGGKAGPGKCARAYVGDRIRQLEHACQKTQALKGLGADPFDGNAVDLGGNGQGHAFRAGLRQSFQISLCKSGDGSF